MWPCVARSHRLHCTAAQAKPQQTRLEVDSRAQSAITRRSVDGAPHSFRWRLLAHVGLRVPPSRLANRIGPCHSCLRLAHRFERRRSCLCLCRLSDTEPLTPLACRSTMAGIHNIQHDYMQIPPITRAYSTMCVLTTLAVVSCFSLISDVMGLAMFNMMFCAFSN